MQKLNRDSSRISVLNGSQIGIEFEFYSNLELEETQKSLSGLLNRKIRLEDKAHSDFQPSKDVFKMEPDMSGGAGLIELVTGPMPYRDARLVIIKMLGWIRANGYTTDRASIHLNMSFNTDYLADPMMVSKMNILKFILEFDEKRVYKYFPNRENSTYAKSIKWVMPKNEAFYYNENLISSDNFTFANTKYYGINFEKAQSNYLEFRYIGGKDYEKRADDILHLAEMFIMSVWKSCFNPNFTASNKIEMKRILQKNAPLSAVLKDYTAVNKHWPKIHILVDLQDNPQVIQVQWDRFKKKVLDLLSNGGMEEGTINYDSDFSGVQVKDGKFKTSYLLDGFEFVDCELSGNIENCDLYGCKVKGAQILRSNLYQGTEVWDSKVESSFVHGSCTLNNCYVFGRDGIFKGKMNAGIFREGGVGPHARFSDDTEVIVSKKIKA
ncbi:MAG: hypothetical protein CMC65_02800 [Flavobacteriaceae bacterium]|nr:hypothetical protein [Flavobacteriaceae bacterium]|tara:strand:+ start:3795 stop:5108 length:1314 start_codon:yes stop_codon:yes gene_type:complete